ncbi:MAG: hypothetical protein CME59_12775 [Halioglobus sp.]|nr:hypothetical protein [Halioglobus sp.]|tara:strand:- start:547 stop:1458 length:912 start_codon:yes stop_codon:yes gene_type:complete
MPTEKRPNLFIVGAQKSGTSALAGWLSQHPQVCMSFPKEPGYLAFGDAGYPFPDSSGRLAPATRYVVTSYEKYLALFADATAEQHVLGEASTWYLVTPGMAQKLRDYSPDARIIIILRNPVERAYSAWCHARGDGVESCESFRESLALEEERGEPEFLLRYHRMGRYADDVRSYQEAFPADRLLILFYDDMRADPAAFWHGVCTFLDIDADIEPPYERRYNRSGQPRSRLLQGVLRHYHLKRILRKVIPHNLGLLIKDRLEDINLRSLPPMDAATRDELRAYYREDVQTLSRLTGRDLGAWLE